MQIRVALPTDPDAAPLLEASRALMQALFPPEENFFLDSTELARPGVTLWVATDPRPLGCVALKRCDGYGEVKSLFVAETARGRGVGAALMAQAEASARDAQLDRIMLETGTLLDDALRLYDRLGYRPCNAFGAYRAGGTSVFLEKRL